MPKHFPLALATNWPQPVSKASQQVKVNPRAKANPLVRDNPPAKASQQAKVSPLGKVNPQAKQVSRLLVNQQRPVSQEHLGNQGAPRQVSQDLQLVVNPVLPQQVNQAQMV